MNDDGVKPVFFSKMLEQHNSKIKKKKTIATNPKKQLSSSKAPNDYTSVKKLTIKLDFEK